MSYIFNIFNKRFKIILLRNKGKLYIYYKYTIINLFINYTAAYYLTLMNRGQY